MKLYKYHTKDGTELMSFYDWVKDFGTDDDLDVHNEGVSPALDVLLRKYCIALEVATVTEYEDGEIISGPTTLVFK